MFNHEAERRPLRSPEKIIDTCLFLMENGVRTVLAARADAQTDAEKTVAVCSDTAADRLRAAGFTADDVRL